MRGPLPGSQSPVELSETVRLHSGVNVPWFLHEQTPWKELDGTQVGRERGTRAGVSLVVTGLRLGQ